jgi:hypothetical protein
MLHIIQIFFHGYKLRNIVGFQSTDVWVVLNQTLGLLVGDDVINGLLITTMQLQKLCLCSPTLVPKKFKDGGNVIVILNVFLSHCGIILM